MKKRAVFLDRDGTINEDVGYPNDYSQIKIYPFAFEAIRKINRAGLLTVIITNQSGIGRGLLTEENLQDIHQKMKAALLAEKVYIDGIYYCPHYELSALPEYKKDCACRKPYPGMALQAAADLNLELNNSFVIGDKVEDVLFGLNIKANPILVLTGYGQKSLLALEEKGIKPVYVAKNLLHAVDWIIQNGGKDFESRQE
jgi:D-glycero-D-manno-heptose 1,7-bisphosphate phosphatase